MSSSLWPYGPQPPMLLCPWDFPDKNTGVGCHFLLQGIFPTPGSNLRLLHLLHWQEDALPLSHLGSPVNGRAWIESRASPSLHCFNYSTLLCYFMTVMVLCLEHVKCSCKEKNVTRDDVLREAHRSAAWDTEACSLMLTILNIVMLLPSLATASP